MTKRRLFVAGVILVIGAAIVSFAFRGGTAPTTTTTTTELSPASVVLPGYEQTAVRTVSVIVNASHPDLAADERPQLAEFVSYALKTMGLDLPEPGVQADATLTIDVEGRAESADYPGLENQYTGANYAGTASFEVPGLGSERWEVSGEVSAHSRAIRMGDSYPTPKDAPFKAAFLGVLLPMLTRVWGAEATIETIAAWPLEAWYGPVGEWAEGVAIDITPRLLEMRSDVLLANDACWVLGHIVSYKSVPPEDQSTIVRALISEVDGGSDPAETALKNIAIQLAADAHEDYMNMPDRSAAEWDYWADAHGF